jgi:hypothetical protein
MSKNVKIFAIVVLIIALIIGVSAYVGSQKSTSDTTPLSSSVSPAAGVPLATTTTQNNEFSSLLSTIKSITIDTTIFTNPAYLALRDYPITLGFDVKGRPNPFAPVGNDTGSISGFVPATKVQFETLQPNKVTGTTAELGAQALLSNTDKATVVFEYGTNDLFGSGTAPVALTKNGTALLRVTGLLPQTTYLVRAVLTQGSDITVGNTMTFATSPIR